MCECVCGRTRTLLTFNNRYNKKFVFTEVMLVKNLETIRSLLSNGKTFTTELG